MNRYLVAGKVADGCNFTAQLILIVILWQLGKKALPQARNTEVDEEDPYEGMAYHEDGGQIFPNAKKTQQVLLEWRIWNQFHVVTKEEEAAEDEEIMKDLLA